MVSTIMKEKLLTVKQAAKLINIPEQTIRVWIEEKKLKEYRNDANYTCISQKELLNSIPIKVCLYNKKGGSGKTTTSKLIADFYEKQNKRILLIDLDPQANLTYSYFRYDDIVQNNGIEKVYKNKTLYDYFERHTALNSIIMQYNENIHLLPADIKLDSKIYIDSLELDSIKQDFIPIMKKYQIIIIDVPPSFNALSRLGMLLANYILCPIIAEKFAYDGLDEAIEAIKLIIKHNSDFIDYKVFLSKHEYTKTAIREHIENRFRKELKDKFLINYIPNFIHIVESQYKRENIFNTNNKNIDKIKLFMEELDNIFYNQRGV